MKAAPSNKAARGILGRTLHVVAKLGGGSLNMLNMRCSPAVQSALACLWAPCAALIIDEAPQGAAALYHAVALRSCYRRASAHGVEVSDYAEPFQTFGAMPIVIECGDELQLPPVPASAGLFAELSQAATEHLAGVEIFKQKDYVYRLSTMKRFTDATLVSILTKMRRSGGCKLTKQEWKALCNTDISAASATEQRERLRGTEHWYQSAPTWATVSMAQAIRSRLSAVHAAATLFIIPAKDYVLNRPQNSRLTDAYVVEQIVGVPNMNNTGRLPAIAMVHLGMTIRLTNTVEAPEAVTDSTGEVVGIDLDPDEPSDATEHTSPVEGITILHKLPTVTVKLHNVTTEFHHVVHLHMWRTYYVKLLVLAQARQWLSATERLDPIADAPATPKTSFQLADAIKQPKPAEYAPFGCDFEDAGAYSPVISRLLLYAEIHNCSDHDYGTFSTPKQMMMYTYRQLQEWIIERRRLHQRSDAAESSARELVRTAEDLAAKLCAFASDGIVVKHLIDFALPAKKRAVALSTDRRHRQILSDAKEHA